MPSGLAGTCDAGLSALNVEYLLQDEHRGTLVSPSSSDST